MHSAPAPALERAGSADGPPFKARLGRAKPVDKRSARPALPLVSSGRMATRTLPASLLPVTPPEAATQAALGKLAAGGLLTRDERGLVHEWLEVLEAFEKIDAGVGLTPREAQLVKGSLDPEAVKKVEADFGVPWEALFTDSGAKLEDVLAWLSGEGPDPCPQ